MHFFFFFGLEVDPLSHLHCRLQLSSSKVDLTASALVTLRLLSRISPSQTRPLSKDAAILENKAYSLPLASIKADFVIQS